ncbi:MAG: hypothetical protein RRA45_08315 [Saccharolobus sp.]|jgi:hypothetical protein|uniref:Uncharacterized protein n=1 Tax=Saccharolobus caldissimus TaxID=1702097 RepID=A0AAQ4CW61_9CREN|nr:MULTISPECIES: hypothetical protein [Saccharolobus]MDT7862201.1 hypothetical protein [Saccharolobus sp.]BDC00043.1 hypothetical protein SACC_30590 [Saccharolobus caldissimus]
MNFLSKKERIVLLAIAQAGPSGLTFSQLSALSYILTKDTIQKIIEDLYFNGYINVLRDGDEVRYIASKDVRNAIINLEFHKFKLIRNLDELKKKSEEISKMDKQQQITAFKNTIKDILSIISISILSLLNESPALTLPEYLEILDNLNKEFFSKLLPLIQESITEDEINTFIALVSKYRGEKDAEELKATLQKIIMKRNINS